MMGRYLEIQNNGVATDLSEIELTMKARDERDEKREVSPLIEPFGSINIDTTLYDIAEVVEKLFSIWDNKALLAR